MAQNISLILLDEGENWNGESRVIAHWTELNVAESQESIPQRVEERALKIKAEYLAWVHDLGEISIKGETLGASLKVLNNLSYWWMIAPVLKSPFESDSLYTVFKLRTLEQLYFEKNCCGLIYQGNNLALHRTLQDWCGKLGHPYRRFCSKKKIVSREKGVRRWLRKLPYWVQALAFLIKSWYLRFRHISSTRSGAAKQLCEEGGVTIVTYFPNIDMEKTRRGEYWSQYWRSLHPVLDQLPFKINWVWFYFESSGFKFEEAVSLRDTCNQTNPKKNQYFFIEEFLTPGAFLKALMLYLKIYRKGLRLKDVQSAFSFPGSSMNFFPIMEREWKASLYGNIAMEGALRIVMFDCMAKILPATPWGLFTWENLSWESGLISAWRRHQKNTKIFACQIGFFRDFDLRLYSDPRVFQKTGNEAMLLPDKLCVYDNEGIPVVRSTGFPGEKTAKVEALRYFDLKGGYSIYKKQLPASGRTLLVIMGITDRENQLQFQLLREAAVMGGVANYSQILIKPHPALSPGGLKPVYELNFEFSIKNQSLSELWPVIDVVFGANSTGATWEASWFGIPVIALGAVNSLNLNPLAGLPGVNFVTNSSDLVEQLKNPFPVIVDDHFFTLDEDLKLWKDLLQG